MKLLIMKQDALDFFKNNMHIYYTKYFFENDNKWMTDAYGQSPFVEFKTIDDFELYEITEENSMSEIEFNNCKILKKNLSFLTPSQACEERLWAGLCNGTFYQYLRKRWGYDKAELKDQRKDLSKILSRFFFSSSVRHGIYRNGLSKCWWVGHLLYDEKNSNHFERLDVLGSQDISTKISDLFLSNNFSASEKVLNGIILGIKTLKEDGVNLSTKEYLRPALQYLNAVGGGILLDSLDSEEIAEIFNDYVVSLVQEDDQSLYLENEDIEDDVDSVETVFKDDIKDNKIVWVVDDAKIKLKNLTTNEIKIYKVKKNDNTNQYPPLMEKFVGQEIGFIADFNGIEYELIEIIFD